MLLASCWDVSDIGDPVYWPMFAEFGGCRFNLSLKVYIRPAQGDVQVFTLRCVEVWINFGHKGKCPRMEKEFPLANRLRGSEGASWAPPVGSRAELWPKTDFNAFHASQNASHRDVSNIGDRVCKPMFAEFRGRVPLDTTWS